MTLGEKLTRIFTVLIVLVVLVGGLASAWPAYLRGRSLKVRDAQLAAEIEEKKAQIEAIREKQRRFNTDREFVESLARQNRRVFPGELVFIFEGEK